MRWGSSDIRNIIALHWPIAIADVCDATAQGAQPMSTGLTAAAAARWCRKISARKLQQRPPEQQHHYCR